MRKLFLIILFSFIMLVPFVSAIPDAPESVWLTGLENRPYDSGTITVNWDAVVNENITRYNIYVFDTAAKKTVLVGTNTTPTTFVFSYSSGNYTFNVTAVNDLGEEGTGTKSEQAIIHTEKPVILFKDPTPENNIYTRGNLTTISGSITDKFPDSMKMNWNGADTLQTYTSGTAWMLTFSMLAQGKYSYYVWANDSAGNSIKSETRYITYDITPPSISLSSPAYDEIYDVSTILIEYAVSDVGPVSCWYTHNSKNTILPGCKNATFKPVFDNTTTLILWANDSAGNINSVSSTFFSKTPPASGILSTVPENGKVIEAPLLTGKTKIAIRIKTDRSSSCKYDLVQNISYNSMKSVFRSLPDGMHEANVTIGDNSNYAYYIRCKSTDNVISTEDYVLKFSTAYPEGLILVDPEKKALSNNGITMESLVGKAVFANISLKTKAVYPLTKYTAKITGDGAAYLKATMPKSIANNSLGNLSLSYSPKKAGTFTATVNLSSGAYSTTFLVDMVAFDDFILGLNEMDTTSVNLSERIENLRTKGEDVSEVDAVFRQVQSDMAEVRTLYNDKEYSEARDEYNNLFESYTILKQDVAYAETGKRIVPDNSSIEESSSSGFSLTTIVIAVIVVIVIIIIATSVVSDKEESNGEVVSAAAAG